MASRASSWRPASRLRRAAGLGSLLALAAGIALADSELRVGTPSSDLEERAVLGAVEVALVGRVEVHARRDARRIVLRAISPDGRVLGSGEAPAGLSETSLVITTPTGYETILVLWGTEPQEAPE